MIKYEIHTEAETPTQDGNQAHNRQHIYIPSGHGVILSSTECAERLCRVLQWSQAVTFCSLDSLFLIGRFLRIILNIHIHAHSN